MLKNDHSEKMWFLRLAKSWHKLFRTQFLFGTKIKSTYKNVLRNTKILDLSVKRGSQHPIYVLGPRQKWVDLPPTFFELFINFLVVCHLLLNIRKKMSYCFSVLARYKPFSLWTWSKIKNFEIFYKTKNAYLIKTNDSCFIVKVKILNFWPCSKWKWAISCWNRKTIQQFFLNIQ